LTQPSRIIAVVVIILAASLVVYTVYELTNTPGCVTSSVPTSFTVNGKSYTFTYLAVCEAQRDAGLMNKKVTNTTTMLFAFPYFYTWTFWMKDTNTSLDMIWINATSNTGRVVWLALGTQPYSTNYDIPSSPANFVIEAKAGFAAANGITIGTQIQFG